MVVNFVVVVVVHVLVVVVFMVIVGLLALTVLTAPQSPITVTVVDIREVMLTSAPELAHCAPPPPPPRIVCNINFAHNPGGKLAILVSTIMYYCCVLVCLTCPVGSC